MKNWKKLLVAVLAITMTLSCVPAYGLKVKAAESETLVYGDYQYEVNRDGESVTITGYKGSNKIVEIPSEVDGKNVTGIGDYAFSSRSELTSVTIPNSVTRIGLRAFMRCSGLTGLTIPKSVTRIDALAFMQCGGLTSITVEEGNPQYDSREDCNAIIETDSNTLVQGCKKTVIPNSVTSIGNYTF